MPSWIELFEARDGAPWPGPRPIERSEGALLKGRADDERRFRSAVLDHLLVVLTADSGVGKTSLLNGRLRPNLEADGFRTVYISQWNLGEAAGPGAFIAGQMREQLHEELRDFLADEAPGTPSDAFWDKVDKAMGERIVLVLDQFEELVRYQPSLFRQVLDWLTQLNRRCRIRVIISLRAEYHHQLRTLQSSARPFTMTTVQIEPLTIAGIGEVIKDPTDRGQPITDDAAAAIASAWARHRDADEAPGLLHLQGLLYSIYHDVRDDEREEITEQDVAVAIEAAGGVDRLFGHGLARAMERKLQHCREAALERRLDRVLVDGTDGLVRRILPNLSSGGFKLVLSEWEIARRVLASEINRSELTEDACRQLYRLTKDRFKHEEQALANPWAVAPQSAELARLEDNRGDRWLDWAPWQHDPEDLSSGPMLGMPQRLVFEQEMRRFAFAVRWLELASIVRRSAPTSTSTMVALIHDGFGAALERKFNQPRETFSHTVARINGAIGERLSWPPSDIAEYRQSKGVADSEILTLVNLRWRDCSVLGVDFERLVIANADFRGTRFEGCSFCGVTFINCLLDNASFVECDIIGGPGFDRVKTKDELKRTLADGDRDLPDFVLTVDAATARSLSTYRTYETEAATVRSRTSGLSVHPISGRARGITWMPARAGLAMFGGRLSSLMLRACNFLEDPIAAETEKRGSISLRHIAGSSLDLVEHRGGHLDILDSTIRGITVTAPVKDEATGQGALPLTELVVDHCVLANVWFGEGLAGNATFGECFVAQLTNCNDRSFLIQPGERDIMVGVHGTRAELDGAFLATPARMTMPPRAIKAMDYRSQPARVELDREH